MKPKLLFLIIAMLLLVPALANAAVVYELDLSKLNSTNLYDTNWTGTTAEIDLYNNFSTVGYNQACRHENEVSLPSMWTTTGTAGIISTYTFDEYTNAVRSSSSGGTVRCASLGKGVFTGFLLNKKYNNNDNANQAYFTQTDDLTFSHTVGFKGNSNFIRHEAGDTKIRIADDNSTFVYVMIDATKQIEFARNFSGTGGEAGNSQESAKTDKLPTFWAAGYSAASSTDIIVFRTRGWLSTASKNLSLNVWEIRVNITEVTDTMTVNVTAGNGDEVRVNISCDNRATWTYGSANTSITCSAGTTDTPIILLQHNSTTGAGNISKFQIDVSGGGGPATFKITAIDGYDSQTISNFSVTLKNSTDTLFNITRTGDITFSNLSGIYNITVNSSQAGGYFNATTTNHNVSSNYEASLLQSALNLSVIDALSGSGLSSFTVYTNRSTLSGTNGYIVIPSKAGFHTFNITSTQYPLNEFSYTISALQNLSFTANVTPRFQFYLRREADNSIFDVAGTNTTRLTIFCPTKNIIINFRNNSAESRNSTQENATIDCPYSLMKMDITYSSSSYFRMLIPKTTKQNVTWWLLDLNQDTGVQVNLELVDLTGEFTNGILRIKKAIDQNIETMIEQFFDIESSTVNYLLKDGYYTVSVESNVGNERQLGNLIADTAGTKTITLPSIPFYPDKVLYDNISWSYTFNITAGILRLQYEDKTTNTTLIRLRIYNGSNATSPALLQTFESTNPGSSVTFTYNNPLANQTYFTDLHVENALLNFNITEQRTFGDFENYLFPFAGFKEGDADNIKFYASAIFLVVWGLLFSAKHVGLGLTSTFIWIVILRMMGWFPIHAAWLALIGLIAFFGWVVEAMKK